MTPKLYSLSKKYIALWFAIFSIFSLSAQTQEANSDHELTLYVIPTLIPLSWENPSALYKSMKNCYVKTIGQSDNYLLGHLAVGIKSTLLEKPILLAQTSGSLQEKLDLILKQKVGFGIMGAAMQGRIETEAELVHKFAVYERRQKLAFIRFKINEAAAARILKFIKIYSDKTDTKHSASDLYGGAFWPLYQKEGSGCSAFGMALLDLAQILPEENIQWRVDVKIPMNIIGGEYNHGKKIKNKTIYETTHWYEGNGEENVDYVRHVLYEPSIIFEWILAKRKDHDSKYLSFDDNNRPGLIVDMRHVEIDAEKPIFKQRTEPNLFIEKYKEKTLLSEN